MPNKKRRSFSGRKNRRSQKGQVLVIVVFAITALVAFVGLVIDTGLVFIQYGRLRRSVDAAALSASLQYREGFTIVDLEKAAIEFLILNGIDDPSATVDTCDTELLLCDANGNGDPTESGEQRKLVHVIARSNVNLAFLTVLGIRSVPLAAEAVSEAASLDVVLVIDRSESMTWDAPVGNPMRDPRQCNAADPGGAFPGDCAPFEDVKKAAFDFVDQYLFFPYDRVAVVTFDSNPHVDLSLTYCGDNGLDETTIPSCSNHILNTLKNLSVFDPEPLVPDDATLAADPSTAYLGGCFYFPDNPCRRYEDLIPFSGLQDGNFGAFGCPQYEATGDPSACTSTNTGGGLLAAGDEFGLGFRSESLWVVILLSDGVVNSSSGLNGGNDYCPSHVQPFCLDDGYVNPGTDPDIRHCLATDNAHCLAEGGVEDVPNYNTDDFARDMADFVALPAPAGQGALIFAIGLGDLVTNFPIGDPENGEEFLAYAADVGGGLYYFAPSGNQLRDIFTDIADNIAVRLTH